MGMDVGNSGDGSVRSEINVAPLVDVVLVLLIIFMVLTPSMLKHLSASVPKEPEDDQAQPTSVQSSTILVKYTAKREVTVNGESVALDGLQSNLADRLHKHRKKIIFFAAEDGAPYGEVVKLMDLARGAGAERLAIITDKL
jgi:biopolymer transport protein ExbD